jgi:hypothetical protein
LDRLADDVAAGEADSRDPAGLCHGRDDVQETSDTLAD